MNRITDAQGQSDFSVDLRFEDRRQARVNLAELVRSAAVATLLRDPAPFVGELTILEGGDVLRWSDKFEIARRQLAISRLPDDLVWDYMGRSEAAPGRPAA